MIIKEFFSKFKDNSRTNCTFLEFKEFSRTKVIFKDFSRSVRTLNMRGVLSTYAKMSRGCFVRGVFCPTFLGLI